jgi:hypothetical protein
MKIGFRIYLFLLIVFSFTLGMPNTCAEQESSLALKFAGSADVFAAAKVFVLLMAHVLFLFLLTMKQSPAYRYFIVYFPIAFLLTYFLNFLPEYLIEPNRFLTVVPFLLCYVLAIIQYNAVIKADPEYALGLPEKADDEHLPREYDPREPM